MGLWSFTTEARDPEFLNEIVCIKCLVLYLALNVVTVTGSAVGRGILGQKQDVGSGTQRIRSSSQGQHDRGDPWDSGFKVGTT